MPHIPPFIAWVRQNADVHDEYWHTAYTINEMPVDVGVFQLKIDDDALFYLVFSCPNANSQNVFFAVAENDYRTAALCVAYCEYFTHGHAAHIAEYIVFNQVFWSELAHLHGILLSHPQQMPVLRWCDDVIDYQGKMHHALLCIPCSAAEHDVLSRLGFVQAIEYFYQNDKNLADFGFQAA